MTPNNAFEKITATIESKVHALGKSAPIIAEEIAQEFGIALRDLSTVFSFLTGKSLNKYIKERQLNAAYEYIVTDMDKFDAKMAVELSGLGDQPSFNKRFKGIYNMTPTEAFRVKKTELIEYALSWDDLLEIDISLNKNMQRERPTSKSLYGIDSHKCKEIEIILDYKHVYGFDELQSELAYYIYSAYDISLSLAFRFISEFPYKSFDNKTDDTRKTHFINHVKTTIADPELRYIYFECNVTPLTKTFSVIERLHDVEELNVVEIDKDAIEIYSNYEINIAYCKEAVKYFKDHATEAHGRDAFEEYFDFILSNTPIEIAFDSIINLDFDIDELQKNYTPPELEIDDYEILETFTDFSIATEATDELLYDISEEEFINSIE